MEEWPAFHWLAHASIPAVASGVFVSLLLAFFAPLWLRSRTLKNKAANSRDQSEQNLIVSGVLVVLGLFMAFTFSLAVERFEQRRMLVVTEADAIGTAYLRAQLLDEPDRTRLSELLSAYTQNRIELANSRERNETRLATNDRLLTQVWAAVSAAMDTPKGQAIGTPLLLAFNQLIDLDTDRKVARATSLPGLVIVLLYLFLVVTALVLGFVLVGRRSHILAMIMFVLFTLAISVIADLNRATSGSIIESQLAMLLTRNTMEQPRSLFDQYKIGIQGGPPRRGDAHSGVIPSLEEKR